jgi:hypothetical protein
VSSIFAECAQARRTGQDRTSSVRSQARDQLNAAPDSKGGIDKGNATLKSNVTCPDCLKGVDLI